MSNKRYIIKSRYKFEHWDGYASSNYKWIPTGFATKDRLKAIEKYTQLKRNPKGTDRYKNFMVCELEDIVQETMIIGDPDDVESILYVKM